MRFLVFTTLVLSSFVLNAQQFSTAIEAQALACQIDGDIASGYNKIGGRVMVLTNWEKEHKSYSLGLGVCQRGSRRNLSVNASGTPMNLVYNMVDVKAGINYEINPKWAASASLIAAYIINAKDKEGYIQNLTLNNPKANLLGQIGASYGLSKHANLFLSAEYSAISFVKVANASGFRGGARFNVLGLGINYLL